MVSVLQLLLKDDRRPAPVTPGALGVPPVAVRGNVSANCDNSSWLVCAGVLRPASGTVGLRRHKKKLLPESPGYVSVVHPSLSGVTLGQSPQPRSAHPEDGGDNCVPFTSVLEGTEGWCGDLRLALGKYSSQTLASVNISFLSSRTSFNFPELRQLPQLCGENSNFWGSARRCGSKAPRSH